MKAKTLLSFLFLAFSATSFAQSSNRAYAITGDGINNFFWMNIRAIDINKGTIDETVFDRQSTSYTVQNVLDKKTTKALDKAETNLQSADHPTGTFVAAAAIDKRSNKLFFMPMRVAELRWIDLDKNTNQPKFYSINVPELKASADCSCTDESKNITRMAIALNGKGYAISNDGNIFIEFTTGNSPKVSDLGSLVDAASNGAISVHEKNAGWGGDIVADAFGKLWLVTANRNVFAIDIKTREATYKGAITGLPENFTTNGAAVDANGKITVCSAIMFAGYYAVDANTLEAVKLEGSDMQYNASDLASSNLLFQKEADVLSKNGKAVLPTVAMDAKTTVYPNPVRTNSFNVQLPKEAEGRYNLVLTDLSGKVLQTQVNTMAKGQQIIKVNLAAKPAAGTYLLKVINEAGRIVLTDKVIVQ